jgi:UDP-N-acetylenolpyruvoylglucosamine reductase
MNTGKGTTREAKALANILKRRVQKKFGITLEEEVRYI